MTGAIGSMALGYLLGSFNPAALVAAIKKKNLQERGTKNLGATNTMLVFGKFMGAVVLAVDILKAYLAVKLARALFPEMELVGLLAGCSAVVGHIFPLYLKFKGGKGLACFGGMILAHDPGLFLILLLTGIALMFITDYGIALPFSATTLAPFLGGLRAHSWGVFGLLLASGALILFKHKENMRRLRAGTELHTRAVIAARWKKSADTGAYEEIE